MPSFKLLSDPELDALVHYVKYLAIRGEVERGLMDELNRLAEGERLIDTLLREESFEEYAVQIGAVTDVVTQVIRRWERAPTMVTSIPQNPVELAQDEPSRQEARAAAIARGRELFYGKFDCKKCHGESGLGDGTTNDYDDWTKVWLEDPLNKTAAEREALERTYRRHGALPSRNIRPRNLRLGVYRGGRRPIDLFRRLRNGIDGTPMPGVAPTEPDEDVWAVVEYVRSLPYESISRPKHEVENVKEIR